MTKDIKDIGEKEFTKLYDEYQAALGRPRPGCRSSPGPQHSRLRLDRGVWGLEIEIAGCSGA
jgi:hypothetical protein